MPPHYSEFDLYAKLAMFKAKKFFFHKCNKFEKLRSISLTNQ